jgi:hypothetical protein
VVATKVTLATSVSFVRAVRGYKSTIYIAQDQGLVVVYLKSGTAYYRNYCRQADESVLWEEERTLTALGSDLTSVHVHRLNDYRLGFVGSSPTANKWLITSRTYVGASVPPETIVMALDQVFNGAVIPIEDSDYTITLTPTVSDTEETDLYVTCNFDLEARKDLADCINFVSSSSSVKVESYNITGNTLHIKINSWPAGAQMTCNFIKNYMCALIGSGYVAVPNDTLTFLIKRYGYTTENISMAPSLSGTITQKHLETYYGYEEETVNISLSLGPSNAIVQKEVTKNYGYEEETVTMTLGLSATTSVSFVGTEPI